MKTRRRRSKEPEQRSRGPLRRGQGRQGFDRGKPLPPTFEVDILGLNEHGEPVAAPVVRGLMGAADRFLVTAGAAVGKGERWLVKVENRHKGTLFLAALKAVTRPEHKSLIGLVVDGNRVKAMHRDLGGIDFALENPTAAVAGETVRFIALGRPRNGPTLVKVMQNLGANPKGVESLAAIENAGLPVEFPEEVVAEAEGLPAYVWKDAEGRTDWRKLSFVTIDGPDARDFDDAVFAEPMEAGFKVYVAIADVAFYVQPGTALDDDAQERGNSTYFPDRVIPMLPERLSNDLCSLRPKVDRPVFGVEMEVDGHGRLGRFVFHRGTIHSHARLTYGQVQAALDGTPDDTTLPLLPHLKNLLAAYKSLDHARLYRGALDLELPELAIEMDKDGNVVSIGNRDRLTSHKLIEELMILANVAAATALSGSKVAGFYRIHDRPDKLKLQNLAAALKPLGISTPGPEAGHKAWAHLVEQLKGHPARNTLMRQMLQSQMQAKYDVANIGHYGLALPLYSHFTSPIRRYADLVTHRALLHILGHKPHPLPTAGDLTQTATNINLTERRSQMAEWEARDRIMARHYAQFVGKEFVAIVTSVQSFGMFVSVDAGIEGLLPARMMGWDWNFNPAQVNWHNRRHKLTYSAGSTLKVVLRDADRLAGRLTFGLVEQKVEGGKRAFRGVKK